MNYRYINSFLKQFAYVHYELHHFSKAISVYYLSNYMRRYPKPYTYKIYKKIEFEKGSRDHNKK